MIAGKDAAAMRRSDFDFELPEDLIAQAPPAERSAGRLLWLPTGKPPVDGQVRDLPGCLRPGDLLVFNDTRVIPARLFARRPSGGRVEILVERLQSDTEALAQLRSSKSVRDGERLAIDGVEAELEVVGRDDVFFRLRRLTGPDWPGLLDAAGHVPLPPYIRRPDDPADRERYQTVFARSPGAVAAPTAGLHFDHALLQSLTCSGVSHSTLTLHVGAGTFQPVREEQLNQHRMHPEWYVVPEDLVAQLAQTRAKGGRIIAVGTTVARALESAAENVVLRPGSGETRLFISPGYRFRTIDGLLTNFHLPQSTLLMLVCAFGGHARTMAAYAHAVRERYRFFSYGDAMLVEPDTGAPRA